MRKSRFTDEQIALALRQAEAGTPVGEICHKLQVDRGYCLLVKEAVWQPGGARASRASIATRGEQEAQAARSRSHAGQVDPAGVPPKKILRPTERRVWVRWVVEAYRVSVRRACQVTGTARSTVNYHHRRPDQEPLRRRIRELAFVHVSYGYRRIQVILRREGWEVNHKRTHRLYCEEALTLRRKRPKQRRSAVRRQLPVTAQRPDHHWAMDFVHDALATGEKIRVLTVIDLFTRDALAVEARIRFKGEDVAEVLTRLGARGVLPEAIRCDQGTEFTSLAMDQWAYWNKVRLDFSRRGKPGDNALCEAFNGTLRRECLSQHYFLNLEDAQRALENWRIDYNNHRPHSSLDQTPPARFRAEWTNTNARSKAKTGRAFGPRLG